MTIDPTPRLGLAVSLIFSIGMRRIVFEAKLYVDKFKPALFKHFMGMRMQFGILG